MLSRIKRSGAVLAVFMLVGAGCVKSKVTTFEECVGAGNPVMESYPRQCRADGKTFVEEVKVLPVPAGAVDNSSMTLKVGETKTYASGLKVALKAIDDSRCPKGVQCVWAGELSAVLSVALDAPGSVPMEVRLGQTTKPKSEAYGFTFELSAIDKESVTLKVAKK